MTERLSDDRLEKIAKGHMTVSKHGFSEERRMMASELIAARIRIADLEKLDREAATCVESVICMRTGFTGEPPYVGWRGLGLALTEALDERDRLRAAGPVIPPLFAIDPDGTVAHIPEGPVMPETPSEAVVDVIERCKYVGYVGCGPHIYGVIRAALQK